MRARERCQLEAHPNGDRIIEMKTKDRLLILIVAYKAESTIRDVIDRIPSDLSLRYETQILIIDDSSDDSTYDVAVDASARIPRQISIEILRNPKNLGYGGNQQVGFEYAIANKFDLLALVHGDGQYAPESLPELLEELVDQKAALVIGSRMLVPRGALKGGMPFYKYVGNRILTSIQNKILKRTLSEFHSGYRVYKVSALKDIAFAQNTHGFNYDTQVCYQLFSAGEEVVEAPIPTYYGDEICYVDGLRYAREVVAETIRLWGHELGIFYDLKYVKRDSHKTSDHYQLKTNFDSTHRFVQESIGKDKAVLDIGCGSGTFGEALQASGCRVVGIDMNTLPPNSKLDDFYRADLEEDFPEIPLQGFDYLLLMDVLEHLTSPERFLLDLHHRLTPRSGQKIVMSTGNVCFILSRILVLFGIFSYGDRGILDINHKRLFNLHSFCRLCTQTGYELEEVVGIPAPYQQVLGKNWCSALLTRINLLGIKVWKAGFSWQLVIVARRQPSPADLLSDALRNSIGRRTADE